MDIDVTRWPPSATFPQSAPRYGIRADRHDPEGGALAYKIWMTDARAETAIYRPEARAGEVEAFLREVRDVAAGHAALPDERNRDTEGGLVTGDVADVILSKGEGEGCSTGIGRWGRGPWFAPSVVWRIVLDDVDARLSD